VKEERARQVDKYAKKKESRVERKKAHADVLEMECESPACADHPLVTLHAVMPARFECDG